MTYKDIIITSKKQLVLGDVLIDDAPHNLEGGSYKGILMNAYHNASYDAEANGFDSEINSLIDSILNRGDFSYNYEDDPLYRQYEESYTAGADKAMNNAMRAASARTGGYGNSYTQTELNEAAEKIHVELSEKYKNPTGTMLNSRTFDDIFTKKGYSGKAEKYIKDYLRNNYG